MAKSREPPDADLDSIALMAFAAHTISSMSCLSSLKIATAVQIWIAGMFLLAGTASAQQFSVTSWGHKDGLPSTTVYAITQAKDGFLWIGTGDGLFRFDGLQFIQSGPPGAVSRPLGPDIASASRNELKADKHGLIKEKPLVQEAQPKLPQEADIRKILHDASGATWMATRNEGVFRIAPNGDVQHFTRATGLPSDHVWDIFEDREGNIWAGTQNGLARLRQDKFITYTVRNGLLSDIANALAPASGGGVWIASRSGLERFIGAGGPHDVLLKGTAASSLLQLKDGALLISTPSGMQKLPPHSQIIHDMQPNTQHVERMAQSDGGDLWLYGQQAGLLHWRSGANPEPVNEPALEKQAVTSMQGGQRDQVWIGLENGDVVLRPPAGSHIFTPADGLTGGAIRYLSPQPDGTLWAASDRGLAYFDGEHFYHWDRASGLPGDRLIWTVADQRGNLWLGYSTGIARLSIRELLHPSSRDQQLRYDFYDDGDGLKSNPEAYGNSPFALTSDGRLWVSMSEGIGMIDLAHVHLNALAPPVHILDLAADGRGVAPARGMKISAHTRTLQISYTGISLTEPRRVRFRYRLEGFDAGWQDAGTRRSAFYTNLRPGRYRFQVIAANSDGTWNETGDSVAFEMLPAFYQTWWFLVLCALAMLSLVYMAYRLRIRFAARELQARYDERLAERTRIAQDLHDNLIQEMTGISLQLEIADEVTPIESIAKGPLRRALDLSRSALGSGRNALHILRQKPLSRADIESTLKDTVQSMTGSQEVIRFAGSGKECPIQSVIGEEIVQIIREALRNAIQHAGRSEITVRSEYGDRSLTFVVSDRGPGISEEVLQEGKPGHFGIRGMRERAARIGSSLTVSSSAATGTAWTLSVPAQAAYETGNRNPGDRNPGNHGARVSIFKHYLRLLTGKDRT